MGIPGEEGNQTRNTAVCQAETRHGPVSIYLFPHVSSHEIVEGMSDKQTFIGHPKCAIYLTRCFAS